MEVHFTPEQEAELSRIATPDGMDAEHFVKEAALRLVERTALAPQSGKGSFKPTRASLLTTMKCDFGLSGKNDLNAHPLGT